MRGSESLLLLAAEDEGLRGQLVELLGTYPCELAREAACEVLEVLDRCPSLRLLILCESSPDRDCLDLLQAVREGHQEVAVIVVSSHPTIEHATEAIRRGAEDFVPVPFAGEVLRKEVERVLDAAELRDRVEHLRNLVDNACGFDRIVCRSAAMRAALDRARAAARSDTPVLLTGETGTGKELMACAIHAAGRRAHKAFIPINCAALPHDLLESELFGHRRGAFTGAEGDYAGLFVAAHGGTLFLDEIGELSKQAQAKLLRALQGGEIRPLGGFESRRVDVRIVAATNRSLNQLRKDGFREDLFFRLSVLVLELPPLRARPDDIAPLIAHFLARIRSRGIARVEGIEPRALDRLLHYPFPGNVRELENLLEALAVTLPPERTVVGENDLRGWLRRRGAPLGSTPLPPDTSLRLTELEAWAIAEALRLSHGNKTRAALLLGISRDTLYRKLHERDLDSSDTRTIGRTN